MKDATIMKSLARCMEEAGTNVVQLAAATALDRRLLKAIVNCNYAPSPQQGQTLAAALGVSVDEISWGHAVPVEYLRGNGPHRAANLRSQWQASKACREHVF